MCIAAPIGLDHPQSDCELVSTMLEAKGVRMLCTLDCDPKGATGKAKALRAVEDFLREDAAVYVLYYSGHGERGEPGEVLGGETGGALVVGLGGGERGLVTLADLIGVWVRTRGRRRGSRFLLVVDACYSGKLVSKLRCMPKREQDGLGIAIQAAGNARQCRTADVGTEHV